jgi:hypothetical protein
MADYISQSPLAEGLIRIVASHARSPTICGLAHRVKAAPLQGADKRARRSSKKCASRTLDGLVQA